MTDNLECRLLNALQGNLPGEAAQFRMAPKLRQPPGWISDPARSHPSGVLLLLFPKDEGWYTVFIHRSLSGPHGGQISLPGGRMDPEDTDLRYTALREAREEIGVDPGSVRILGQMTPLHVPHSHNMITPFVGIIDHHPEFIPEPAEVADIITVSVPFLFHPENRKTTLFRRPGYRVKAPCYHAGGHCIWGATAMIVSEFEDIFTSCISG